MRTAQILLACYPRAVREHWGEDLLREIDHQGPKGWANALMGAGDQWLHPHLAPDATPGRRRALATYSVTMTMIVCLLDRAVSASSADALSADLTTIALGCGILATACLAPLPGVRGLDQLRLVFVVLRALWAPTVAFAVLLILARSPVPGAARTHPVAHVALETWYWATLSAGCVQSVRAFSSALARGLLTTPRTSQVRLSLLVSAAGAAVLGACSLRDVAQHPGALVAAALLGALIVPTIQNAVATASLNTS